MKVLISGSSGFIGSALSHRLSSSGHRVIRLVRHSVGPGQDAVGWDPERGEVDAAGLEGIDGVVHLAAEGVGDHRWTERHKARVLSSRVRGTTLLAETIAGLDSPPKVMISQSATGYYGDGGDEKLTEESPQGKGFLADAAEQWETSSEPAAKAGIRVVNTRTGVVLHPSGGSLREQVSYFRLGIGATIASGRQYLSWITREDLLSAFEFLLEHDGLSGPVNVTSPNPVTNARWTRALGAALHRPTILRVPGLTMKVMFSAQMAEEMILFSQRVLPVRLLEAGFEFADPDVEVALQRMLG